MQHVSGRVAEGSAGRFREGLRLLGDAVRLLQQSRSLWLLASVPVFLALLFVGAAVSIFWANLPQLQEVLWALLPVLEVGSWWTWIWIGPGKVLIWLTGWLGVLLVFAISLVASLLLANLLAAPFLDQLSQRVERIVLEGPSAGAEGLPSIVGEALRSFLAELSRLAFLGGIWLLLSTAGFLLPGAHLITGPLLIGITVLFLPLDYAGYTLDRRQVSFQSRRRWVWQNLPMMTGFGGVAFVACLVPGLNLLMLPAFVTAGTLLVLRRSPEQTGRGSEGSEGSGGSGGSGGKVAGPG
ncbi:MAG: hypothetical protein CL908_19135 [Deltaproteobacteria bacterium]|nr:hypothetical protein [Deltaproteobacteria bacterium]